MMKKVLVINANPKSRSFCKLMAEHYAATASARRQVTLVHLSELQFQADLSQGYDEKQQLEPDLVLFQQQLQWAEHIVLICPVWWGGMPAKLKGLFDRVLLPGFAFSYQQGKAIPDQLLKGRTSELLLTLDTPVFWYKWWQGNPLYFQLTRTILGFVGIKNQASHYFSPVLSADAAKRQRWLDKVQQLASR
ncbi:NAD(P)H dehydrogenase [Rheinheimera sp. SA_1]|nr:NAD(P)H dehydrogenase [Rheinheimera sp. SA_1]